VFIATVTRKLSGVFVRFSCASRETLFCCKFLGTGGEHVGFCHLPFFDRNGDIGMVCDCTATVL
jgi:hypothetical protein